MICVRFVLVNYDASCASTVWIVEGLRTDMNGTPKKLRLISICRTSIFYLLMSSIGLSATKLWASDDEIPRVGLVQIVYSTALRARPESEALAFTIVPVNTRLYWVEGQESNGFFRVVGMRGPSGWVAAGDVHILQKAPSLATMRALADRGRLPCAEKLSGCSEIGCAKPNTAAALANAIKRRSSSSSSPTLISFHDVVSMQQESLRRVGQGHLLTPAQRALLLKLPTTSGDLGEGVVVDISGFIGADDPGPHVSSGESVNCNLSGSDSNDFHINIAAHPGDSQFAGVVVEIVPQDRNPGWTIRKLTTLQRARRLVLAVGPLFYDSFHLINQDPQHPLSGQPKRFSHWEVHRITGFYVCKRGDNLCKPTERGDWVPLEEFEP